jgi:cbb3-type cytochrome oxidase subunit 1
MGYTSTKEYAEFEWPVDIAVANVWVSFGIVFAMSKFSQGITNSDARYAPALMPIIAQIMVQNIKKTVAESV